ncbi:hypothetical protein HDV05_003987 [Chytridiales sp. JEL 0842]|nr:hypothetical protein HDV05_003987 [Chytridiales sp. JEL 0842]
MLSLDNFGQSFYQVLEVYAVVVLLHKILPAATAQGYCCDFQGRPLTYRLNGLLVLIVSVLFYSALAVTGLKDPAFLSNNFLACWMSGLLIGSLASVMFYVEGLRHPPVDAKYLRCVTTDMIKPSKSTTATSTTKDGKTKHTQVEFIKHPVLDPKYHQKPWIVDFWNGLEFNPRVAGIDVKMMLYTLGAVLLQLNIISMAVQHAKVNGGNISNAMLVYLFAFTWFLVEYSYFENVHLYTYDLIAEKIGFKLLFGCLGFYPFAYALGGTILTTYAPLTDPLNSPIKDISPTTAALILLTFYTGWIFTRGPNMQKFYFKLNPTAPTFFFGLIPQRALPGTRIIVSGFWGMSRHINYLGEVLQSVALALPGFLVISSYPLALIPWIYPLYYIALFIPRERDDHEVCKRKYGKDWDTYCKMTPWRIIPYIY